MWSLKQDQTTPLLEEGVDGNDNQVKGQSILRKTRIIDVLAIVGYFCSAFILVASLGYPTDAQCTERLSTWSPMLEGVRYEWRSLLPAGSSTGYIGTPSKSKEKAWFELWAYGAIGIREEDLPRLNKSIDARNWTRLAPDLGGGVKAYFEGFHHIHCLDLIRQFSYRDEYDYSELPAWQKPADAQLSHVEHCIEILRNELACIADTTPYPISIGEDDRELVHVNTDYKCRQWDALTTWATTNIVEPYNATEEILKHSKEQD